MKLAFSFSGILALFMSLGVCLTCMKTAALFAKGQGVCMEWEIMSVSGSGLTLPFFLDTEGGIFGGVVMTIATSVFMFSSSYMAQDKYFLRFHLLVLSFVLSMLLLISSPSLMSLMLGWDGLGVTSYLLVIYFQSSKAYGAGMITALTNRVGDVILLVAISLTLLSGSWLFWLSSPGGFVSAALMVAAMTKSAQIPFSAWLPAAMAAPTPVSSLVHSSTLVTAGVYLLFRGLSCQATYLFLFWVGSLTMIMASMSALYEIDMKKIVALSTLSQLGFMFISLGLGLFKVAFFHLLAHAFFKALLFISVGSLIHQSDDFQDLRKVSVCHISLPITFSLGVAANMSLSGIPFCAGFYSKDLVIESALSKGTIFLEMGVMVLAVVLTVLYSLRFTWLVCWASSNTSGATPAADKDTTVEGAMLLLFPLAIMGGSILSYFIFSVPLNLVLPTEMKNLALILIGGACSVYLSTSFPLAATGAWDWGSLWALPFVTPSGVMQSGLKAGMLGRNQDLSWVFFTHTLPASFSKISEQVPSSGPRAEPLLKFVGLALLLLILLYTRMAMLITFFEVKSQCGRH